MFPTSFYCYYNTKLVALTSFKGIVSRFWMVLVGFLDGMFGGMFWAKPVTMGLPCWAQNIPLYVGTCEINRKFNNDRRVSLQVLLQCMFSLKHTLKIHIKLGVSKQVLDPYEEHHHNNTTTPYNTKIALMIQISTVAKSRHPATTKIDLCTHKICQPLQPNDTTTIAKQNERPTITTMMIPTPTTVPHHNHNIQCCVGHWRDLPPEILQAMLDLNTDIASLTGAKLCKQKYAQYRCGYTDFTSDDPSTRQSGIALVWRSELVYYTLKSM